MNSYTVDAFIIFSSITKPVQFIIVIKLLKLIWKAKQIECVSVLGVDKRVLDDNTHVLGRKLLLELAQFLVIGENITNASTVQELILLHYNNHT